MKFTRIFLRGHLDKEIILLIQVYAVERSAKRCETLRKIVDGAGADSVVQVMNRDFLDLNPSEYADVEYIVLDPSCSGSGMASCYPGKEIKFH